MPLIHKGGEPHKIDISSFSLPWVMELKLDPWGAVHVDDYTKLFEVVWHIEL